MNTILHAQIVRKRLDLFIQEGTRNKSYLPITPNHRKKRRSRHPNEDFEFRETIIETLLCSTSTAVC